MQYPSNYLGSDLEFQNFGTDSFDMIGNENYLESLANSGGRSSFLGGSSGKFFDGKSGLENVMGSMGLANSLAGLIGGFQTHGLMKDALNSNIATARQDRAHAQEEHNKNMAIARHNANLKGITFDA